MNFDSHRPCYAQTRIHADNVRVDRKKESSESVYLHDLVGGDEFLSCILKSSVKYIIDLEKIHELSDINKDLFVLVIPRFYSNANDFAWTMRNIVTPKKHMELIRIPREHCVNDKRDESNEDTSAGVRFTNTIETKQKRKRDRCCTFMFYALYATFSILFTYIYYAFFYE